MNNIPVSELNSFKTLEWNFDRAFTDLLDKFEQFHSVIAAGGDSDESSDISEQDADKSEESRVRGKQCELLAGQLYEEASMYEREMRPEILPTNGERIASQKETPTTGPTQEATQSETKKETQTKKEEKESGRGGGVESGRMRRMWTNRLCEGIEEMSQLSQEKLYQMEKKAEEIQESRLPQERGIRVSSQLYEREKIRTETLNSDEDDNDYDEEEEEGYDEEEDDQFNIEPEMVTMALCFAKLMTKCLLNAERAAHLEHRVRKLEQENCTLRAVAKNCQNLSMAMLENTDKSCPSVMNLNESLQKEVDTLLKVKNKAMQVQRLKYQNKIFGLHLAIDYFKKELSGRVQQLQLMQKLFNDGESRQPTKEAKTIEQFVNILKQLNFEIILNRYKTLARLAECKNRCYTVVTAEDGNLNEKDFEDQEDDCSWYNLLFSDTRIYDPRMVDYTKLGHLRFVSIYVDKEKPIGLVLVGGSENSLPLIIWRVVKDSVAAHSQQFRDCDIILSIQKYDMIGASQEYAIQLLRSTTGWCRFGIVRIPIGNLAHYLSMLRPDNFELFHTRMDGDSHRPKH